MSRFFTGDRTSVYSKLVGEAHQRGKIDIGTRHSLRRFGKGIAKRLPYVAFAIGGYEVYDVFKCD